MVPVVVSSSRRPHLIIKNLASPDEAILRDACQELGELRHGGAAELTWANLTEKWGISLWKMVIYGDFTSENWDWVEVWGKTVIW